MANKALLEAVNKAIEALENVKRELERAEAPQTAPVAPTPTSENLAAQSAPEPKAAGQVPQTSKSMSEAAKLAAERCAQWKFQDEMGEAMDASMLIYACGEQDASAGLDPNDSESWYVVSPDGAIGLTEDNGASVTWLFLPLGRTMASMPKKVRKDEPWPEAAVAPAPKPASAPTPAPQSAPVPSASEVKAVPTPKLTLDPTPDIPTFDFSPAPKATAAGTVCPSCGKPVKAGNKFCMSCGTSIPAAAAPASAPAPTPAAPQGGFCMQCGAPLQPGDKFCMSCGAKA